MWYEKVGFVVHRHVIPTKQSNIVLCYTFSPCRWIYYENNYYNNEVGMVFVAEGEFMPLNIPRMFRQIVRIYEHLIWKNGRVLLQFPFLF